MTTSGCRNKFLLLSLLIWAASQHASGQEQGLTLAQALDRARQQAPAILAARDRIEEARGRLKGASLRFRENPTVNAFAGKRNTGETELDLSFIQPIEPGGRRQARIAGARAYVERETSVSYDVTRGLLKDVANAYLQAAAATRRVRISVGADQVATNLLFAMQRRFELWDVSVLEVNVAKTAAARTLSERRSSEAQLTEALGNLRILLGMTAQEPLSIAGEIPTEHQLNLANLLQEAEQRPDLQVMAAELRQAEAEMQLGKAFGRPDFGVGFSFEREEGEIIAQGGISISLPVFARGQELQATGSAKAMRLRRELQATRRAIEVEVRSAVEQYQQRLAAAEELQRIAASLDENEALALRSFEEGEIGVMQLLFIRRDNFEIRSLYVSRLLEAAVSAIEVQSLAGALR